MPDGSMRIAGESGTSNRSAHLTRYTMNFFMLPLQEVSPHLLRLLFFLFRFLQRESENSGKINAVSLRYSVLQQLSAA